jgi:hypothetical protein
MSAYLRRKPSSFFRRVFHLLKVEREQFAHPCLFEKFAQGYL